MRVPCASCIIACVNCQCKPILIEYLGVKNNSIFDLMSRMRSHFDSKMDQLPPQVFGVHICNRFFRGTVTRVSVVGACGFACVR
jgi:hypothetical protein